MSLSAASCYRARFLAQFTLSTLSFGDVLDVYPTTFTQTKQLSVGREVPGAYIIISNLAWDLAKGGCFKASASIRLFLEPYKWNYAPHGVLV